MGFPRQEYQRGCPRPPLRDLLTQGLNLHLLLGGWLFFFFFLATELPWKALNMGKVLKTNQTTTTTTTTNQPFNFVFMMVAMAESVYLRLLSVMAPEKKLSGFDT